MFINFRVRRVFLALIIALACGTPVAIALTKANATSRTTQVPSTPPAPVSAVPSGVVQDLSVFRRPAQPSDVPPPGVIDGSLVAQQANPQLARLATTVNGQAIYLVPVQGGVCTASSTFLATGCIMASDIASNGGLHMETIKCSPYLNSDDAEIDGVAPDGVSGLSFHESDGSTTAVSVSGNEFAVLVPRTGPYPTSVSWTYGGVAHSAIVPLNGMTMGRQCAATAPAKAVAEQRAAIEARAKTS